MNSGGGQLVLLRHCHAHAFLWIRQVRSHLLQKNIEFEFVSVRPSHLVSSFSHLYYRDISRALITPLLSFEVKRGFCQGMIDVLGHQGHKSYSDHILSGMGQQCNNIWLFLCGFFPSSVKIIPPICKNRGVTVALNSLGIVHIGL